MAPGAWVAALTRELDAGAWKVITEGRESGPTGCSRRTATSATI